MSEETKVAWSVTIQTPNVLDQNGAVVSVWGTGKTPEEALMGAAEMANKMSAAFSLAFQRATRS